MCGRFILLTDLSIIVESFRIGEVAAEYRPGSNIAPGQQILAVIRDEGINKLVDLCHRPIRQSNYWPSHPPAGPSF